MTKCTRQYSRPPSMNEFPHIGRALIGIGLVIAVAGVLVLAADKVPWIGRLPGDIYIKREKFTFYFPLATSILLSLLLTLIFYLVGKK